MGIVRPHLWFDDQAAQAARFYADVIPNTVIHSVTTAPPGTPGVPEGSEFIVELTIDGMRATFLNGGPALTLDEAFSFVLDCADQARGRPLLGDPRPPTADDRASAAGSSTSSASPGRWSPSSWTDVMSRPDADGVARAMAAMLTMGKLDVAGSRGGVPRRDDRTLSVASGWMVRC